MSPPAPMSAPTPKLMGLFEKQVVLDDGATVPKHSAIIGIVWFWPVFLCIHQCCDAAAAASQC